MWHKVLDMRESSLSSPYLPGVLALDNVFLEGIFRKEYDLFLRTTELPEISKIVVPNTKFVHHTLVFQLRKCLKIWDFIKSGIFTE